MCNVQTLLQVICLCFVVIQSVDSFALSNITRIRHQVERKNDCPKENEFRCNSGQCIDQELMCDGKADCDDHSDEIGETCGNVLCPGFTYKCKYGACVEGRAQCNGIIECFDGSDEDPAMCSFALSNSTRIRRQVERKNDCPNERLSFKCKSGECLPPDKECDGTADCQDASDESNACHRIKCPPYLFTCKYGACINKQLECDGKPDCRDGSDENTPRCRTTDKESPECKDNEFRCSSGQCIDQDLKCDGKAECDDHSDEIRATCWNVRCPGFTHKCKYGACVNGRAQCNGIVECFDGSDEDPTICKTPAPVTPVTPIVPDTGASGSCVLPDYPSFGRWVVPGFPPGTYQPRNPIGPGTILKVECDKHYVLDGNNALFCENGQWSSEIGQCSKVCPPMLSTSTMRVTCIYKNKETENCTNAIDGTLAKFECAPFYEDLGLKRHPIHYCQDGTWDQRKPQCVPVCGQKTVESTTLIINGTNVTKGDYPWQVAIYTLTGKSLICGGSLLSQKVILTAAHCVTDNEGNLLSKEKYIVAAGKYYLVYNDSRDYNEAQFSELQAMYVPPEYRGDKQNFLGDIAVLITRKVFSLSRRVQPVCMDSGQTYNINNNEHGYVTGWGFTTENSKQSDVLKELKVPSISFSECKKNLPEDYDVYLTHDKMCAGYIEKGISVCKGDSGGGLVFKHDGRYYITGIVSLSPTSPTSVDGCNSNQYGLYTKVANYITSFILQKLAEFKV